MDNSDHSDITVVARLCVIDYDRNWGKRIPQDRLGSRSAQIERVLENGIDRINPETGEHEHVDLNIAYHDDPDKGFVYASQRVVISGEQEGALRREYPELFTKQRERIGAVTILTTVDKSVDALTVVEQITEKYGKDAASVDHVFWTNQNGHIICREGDDPEPADRPDGPHRDDLDRGRGVRIAVVDNGIASEALTDSWLDEITVDQADTDALRTYTSKSTDPTVDPNSLDLEAGHGTFVTGVIRQVAPGAEIIMIRALDSDGVGLESQLAAGIDRAIASGAQIINLSVGGYTNGDAPPMVIVDALSRVPDDVAVIAAAGNEGTRRPLYPAAIAGVLGVAALDLEGANKNDFATAKMAAYSNRPPAGEQFVATAGHWTSVFVSGVENPLRDNPPDRFDGYAAGSGTSFSAAAMSGMVAVGVSRSGSTASEVVAKITQQFASRVAGRDEILHVDIWSI